MAEANSIAPQLYLVSPDFSDVTAFAPMLDEALSAGAIGAFQLRLKQSSDDEVKKASELLIEVCHRYQVPFILNDRPDLAAQVGADGVHLGEEAELYDQARKLLTKDKIVGVSCYGSTDRALTYAEKGADYVAFGAFYPTPTKEPKARPNPDVLSWWVRNAVTPCVAIGGIDATNCQPLVEAGADFIAVVRAAWKDTQSVTKNIRDLLKSIEAARHLE